LIPGGVVGVRKPFEATLIVIVWVNAELFKISTVALASCALIGVPGEFEFAPNKTMSSGGPAALGHETEGFGFAMGTGVQLTLITGPLGLLLIE